MNAYWRKTLLYALTTALGLWSLALQRNLMTNGLDEKGLLIPGQPTQMLLWGICLVFLAVTALALRGLGSGGTYEQAFPKCILSGGLMVVGGLVMAFSGLNILVPDSYGEAIAALVSGGAMMVCGIFRMVGKSEGVGPDLVVAVYYAWNLLAGYMELPGYSQLYRFLFPILAGVSVMLFSLHRSRCTAGVLERKGLVFWGFAGMYFTLVALSSGKDGGFYLASWLWCAGGMCDLIRLSPVEEGEDEDVSAG